MKNVKTVLIAVTAAFLFVLLGIFIGRNSANHDWILPSSEISDNTSPAEHVTETGRIDINTASADQFSLLPGIGETIAQRIVDYREENGRFSSVEELTFVKGIGEKKLDSIRKYLTVGGQS